MPRSNESVGERLSSDCESMVSNIDHSGVELPLKHTTLLGRRHRWIRSTGHGSPEHMHRPRIAIAVLTVVAVLLVIARLGITLYTGMMFEGWPNPRRLSPAPESYCGNNSTEAAARNCIFDELSLQWTPPSCYNHRVAEAALERLEYLTPAGGQGRFQYFTKEDPKTELQLPLNAPGLVRTTLGFHRAHCSYLWQMGIDAAERARTGEQNVQVLEMAVDLRHSLHCNKVLLSQDGINDNEELFFAGIGRCSTLRP